MPHPYTSCPVESYRFHFTPPGVRPVVVWNPRDKGNCFFDASGVGLFGSSYEGAVSLRKRVRRVCSMCVRVSLSVSLSHVRACLSLCVIGACMHVCMYVGCESRAEWDHTVRSDIC